MSTTARAVQTPRPRRTRLHLGHLALALTAAVPSCSGDDGSGPAAWRLGDAETVTAMAGVPGDTTIEVRCPDRSVVVGYEGRHGDNIYQVRLLCAELREDGTLDALAATDTIGSSTAGSEFSTECAPDSLALTVLVGARGDFAAHILDRFRGVRRFQGQCLRPADVAAGVANDASVRTTAPAGSGGGANPYTLYCPHGFAVTGLKGEYDTGNSRVAAIGLICREIHDG